METKRKPLTPAGAFAVPEASRTEGAHAYIVRLENQIKGLQKVVRDQADFIHSKQEVINRIKGTIAGEGHTLKPSPTSRPARKGAL